MPDPTVLKLSFEAIIVQPFSTIATTIFTATANDALVRVLEMDIAPVTSHDYRVFLHVLLLCTRRLSNLHTLKLFTRSNICTPLLRDTVQQQCPSSITNTYIYITDPHSNDEALIIARNCLSWKPRFYLALDLDHLVEIATYDFRLFPYLRELVIFAPQYSLSLPIDLVISPILAISHIFTSLKKVRLAVTATSVEFILQTLITFPVVNDIKLLFSPPLSGETTSDIQMALYRGMDQFHRLKKLTIPGELLSFMVLNRLMQLEDLSYLKITSASALPYFTLTSNRLPFQALRTLVIEGPLSFIYALASVLPPCPSVRSLYLSATTLQSAGESENTLSKISTLFPKLKSFTYKVENLHKNETSHWFNLQPLLAFPTLVNVIIEHPHALALSSFTVRHYLQAWPRAKLVLLNPNPALGPWRNKNGSPFILPDYDTLADLTDFQRLREFGVYLNNHQIIWDFNQVFIGKPTNTNLKRLALGTVFTLDNRTRTAIQRKFPDVAISSS
jgi:hypothetical protein